ncbi:MAG: hypothetical protein ACRDOY_04970 [Nocardioidaceae bacterium]
MRHWLIRTSKQADLGALRAEIAAHGGTVYEESPIPLGDAEQVVEAEGPDDLPERLGPNPSVLDVSPDTPKHPYG